MVGFMDGKPAGDRVLFTAVVSEGECECLLTLYCPGKIVCSFV